MPSPNIMILLYTGDLAFSGKKEQYELANAFCSDVKRLFETECPATAEFFVPGNHDLDFGSAPDDLRDMANATVKKDVASVTASGTLTRNLLEQQIEFWNFVEARYGVSVLIEQRLFRKERLRREETTVDLNLLNTAFTSTLNEKPGSLVFPDQIISDDNATGADLVLSVMHHPLHWLEPSNARRVKRFMESGCDLIFSGHEHLPDAFLKIRAKENQTCHVEGSALRDPPAKSAFNVVEVDLVSKTVCVHVCSWASDLYVPSLIREFPLVRSFGVGSKFQITPEYSAYLEDPGAFYTHPHKKDLQLSDFFVCPTLRRNSTQGPPLFIDSADCLKFLRDEPRVTIVGEESSGKTALAKTLYRNYLSESTHVPLIINGDCFDSVGDKALRALIRKTVDLQYGASRQEHYAQLPKSSKVLIIDDWHKVRFNDRGRARLMREIKEIFGSIVCFANDLLSMQQITTTGEPESVFADFEQCSLPEFGVRLRGRLIERWLAIGREMTEDEADLAYEVKQSENRINFILEKNFLPLFPFVVLTLLQADSTQVGSGTLGSYGHLYGPASPFAACSPEGVGNSSELTKSLFVNP